VRPNFLWDFQPERGATQLEGLCSEQKGKRLIFRSLACSLWKILGAKLYDIYCTLDILSTTTSILLYVLQIYYCHVLRSAYILNKIQI
jgi:hypothetical protein